MSLQAFAVFLHWGSEVCIILKTKFYSIQQASISRSALALLLITHNQAGMAGRHSFGSPSMNFVPTHLQQVQVRGAAAGRAYICQPFIRLVRR